MKRKILTLVAVIALVTGMGLAQNATNETDTPDQPDMQENQTMADVSTVIIASGDSHLDPAVADAASERIGAPVLLTDPENLSDSTSEALESSNVEQAVIIGGTAAVSEEVENEINSIVGETERVAGETATDTSLEVAEFFWPQGINEAAVVQAPLMDEKAETYQVVSAAANTAGSQPVILADTGEIDVVSGLEDLGINEATVYSLTDGEQTGTNETPENTTENQTPTPETPATGNETENTTDVQNTQETDLGQSLEEAGIDAEVNQGTLGVLTSELYSQIQENPDNREMYAVTGTDFRYGIPTYADPDSVTYIVTDENFQEDMEFLQNSGYESVTAIGEQELGEQITSELDTAEDFIEVQDSSETAAEIFRNNSQEWAEQLDDSLIQNLPFGQAQEQDQTETPEDNMTENETQPPAETPEDENETDNQTETDEQEDVSSSLEIDEGADSVTAEAEYSSSESYDMVRTITQNQTHVSFTFELVPGNETQTGTDDYEFEQELELGEGDYQAQAQLIVDGETVEEETENISIR